MSMLATLPSEIDRRIAATVKALATGQGRDIGSVAATIGVSRGALYQKLAMKAPFKASEVAMLADLFGVRVEEIFNGLDGRFGPPTPTSPSGLLPRLDSNQEPTGNWPLALAPGMGVGFARGHSSARRLRVVGSPSTVNGPPAAA